MREPPTTRWNALPVSPTYPLRFQPIFRHYLWGGLRLRTVLGKDFAEGETCAESWEVVDHGADQSRVLAGPLAGASLHELVQRHGRELLGPHHPLDQFPLLLKFLDAQKTLSVQVHPNDRQAARLDPPDLGKTEAWVVLAAEPGSKIYAGLKPGVDRGQLERHLQAGTCDECLHAFEPKVGDCIFVRAGTVHAIGAGLLIAEIQQSSDATFRLFDWNRADAEGNPRPLHVEQSLEAIDYELGPVGPTVPEQTEDPARERLVNCDKFLLDRLRFAEPRPAGGDGRFHLLAVIEGDIAMEGDLCEAPFRVGSTALLPAAAGAVMLAPHGTAVVLDMCLPLADSP